ncbi:MAG: S-methyl-5-thioribose-1-phosphate isomerase [Euryarchaeota archaeon RBG_19FT_COMBO_56_21]|nr:MAG: S-methyl-5-thioribose-1-phosphate isomerase [Euryarchaeota archaeon RBG_19FT_COMBO_56_21]
MLVKTARGTKDIRALWMEKGIVKAIDQRLLPDQLRIVSIRTPREMAEAISNMTIRGAPSIGAAGAYGMALAWQRKESLIKVSVILIKTRPTAYDLSYAVNLMLERCDEDLVKEASAYADRIVDKCKRIGENGAKLIKDGSRILTHCNAGALATVDFGTALAPIRVAHRAGKKVFVYVDETRPRLQGAKLTAWELLNEGIDHAIISDNAAGHYMKDSVDLVIVGADRIARNGDFANKIGTYTKAVLAKENWVPFYVAAPISTFDPSMSTGKGIIIEERSEDEVLCVGDCRVAPRGSKALNPCFDVTPVKYVKAFVTERGILKPSEISSFMRSK